MITTTTTTTTKAATRIVEAVAAGDLIATETARTVMVVAHMAGVPTHHIVTVMLLALRSGHVGERFTAFAMRNGRNLEKMAVELMVEWQREVGR